MSVCGRALVQSTPWPKTKLKKRKKVAKDVTIPLNNQENNM